MGGSKKFPVNEKKEVGRARKQAAAEEKQKKKLAQQETVEAQSWQIGARKDRHAQEEAKRLEKLAKKQEREALEKAELAELAKYRPVKSIVKENPTAKSSTMALLSGAASIATNAHRSGTSSPCMDENQDVDSYAASNIDDALMLLQSTTTSASQTSLERHPERRVKAAYTTYEERELPILKAQNPGLRLSQLKERLYRAWHKSPENPFNQAHVSYTTKREDEVEMIRKNTETELLRLRLK